MIIRAIFHLFIYLFSIYLTLAVKVHYWHFEMRLDFHEGKQLPQICDSNKATSYFNVSTINC